MWPCWTISLSLASLTLDMWWFWREMSMKIYMLRLVASWWALGKWLVMRAVTPMWMNSMMGSQTGGDRKLKVGPKCRGWVFGDCILSLASSSSSSHSSSLVVNSSIMVNFDYTVLPHYRPRAKEPRDHGLKLKRPWAKANLSPSDTLLYQQPG